MTNKVIYLDYAATTPVDPRVAARMFECLTLDGNFGNPASRSHIYGWRAEEAVENARAQVAELINAESREIVWTSGATESNNLAIKGAALARRKEGRGNHIVTSCIEHKAVLDVCAYLEQEDFQVTYLKPGLNGIVDPEQVEAALTPQTVLVSIMHANNEVGTINDVGAIGAICRSRDVLLHVDAAQTGGRIPIDIKKMQIDLLSLSAHKFYGPKGVGALYVRRRPLLVLQPQMHGGGHERGMRSGTLATHQIVGMGVASEIATSEMTAEALRILLLRNKFLELLQGLGQIHINGELERRLPGNLNISIADVDGEALLLALKDIAVSSGSACTSASLEPSYVLRAMGIPNALAQSALRFSVGRFTTGEDIAAAASLLCRIVPMLRAKA